MSFKAMKRDAERILASIKVTPDGKEFVTEDMFMYVPYRFKELGLAVFGKLTKVYGAHALVTRDGHYAVRNINALFPITPKITKKVKIGDIDYLEFFFPKDSVMVSNTSLIRDNTLIYFFINEIYFTGKLPEYYDYNDMGKLLRTAKDNANSATGDNRKTVELMAAYLGRSPADPTVQLRHVLGTPNYRDGNGFHWAPMKSVFLSAQGTMSKLAGNYMADGVVSSLVHKTDVVTVTETILRS